MIDADGPQNAEKPFSNFIGYLRFFGGRTEDSAAMFLFPGTGLR